MTGKELYNTVAQMGFARTLEDNETYFYRAANLSLARIVRRFPVIATLPLPYVSGERTASFHIESMVNDFSGFPREALLEEGLPLREGRDYRIEGSHLCILRGKKGSFTLRYLHRPRDITPDSMDEAVDILPYTESLLPPLLASYLWLDDRGELATHYLSLYRIEAEEVDRMYNRHGGAHVISRNGWDKG